MTAQPSRQKWVSALSTQQSWDEAFEECCAKCQDLVEPALLFFFVSAAFRSHFQDLHQALLKRFPGARILGCSASGVTAEGVEVEFKPSLSLLVGEVPGLVAHAFYLEEHDYPSLDGSPEAWRSALAGQLNDATGLIVLADPFSFASEVFLSGADYGLPEVPKVGGLASGGQRAGEVTLFLDDKLYTAGAVGLTISGTLAIEPVVAQGCRPVGPDMVVTRGQRNVILELDKENAMSKVMDVLKALPQKDMRLASQALFVGIGAGRPSLNYRDGEFLVRQALGLEPQTGSLIVGDFVRVGQMIRLHIRDGETSAEDLQRVLTAYRSSSKPPPQAALMFSCLGRGRTLYGEAHKDSSLFAEAFGPVELSGFFCNGEIGPVAGVTSLHGFTSSFAFFVEH